jgi:putative flippase GtrA
LDSTGARARYLAVQLCGLGATSGLLWLFVRGEGLHRLSTYALTIPLVTVATFAANRGWTFQNPT